MLNVMTQAHMIANQGQTGSYKEKLAAGLRQAWKNWRNEKMLETLKTLTPGELQNLIQAAQVELESRQPKEAQPVKKELVLYTHNCKGSSNYHRNKYKHWAKLLTGVDATKCNGYAFNGEFLNINAEHKVAAGSVVVEVCDDTISAYLMDGIDNPLIERARTNSMSGLIEKVATYFNK
jgi:hypothetical protein